MARRSRVSTQGERYLASASAESSRKTDGRSDESEITSVYAASADDVDKAVAAARAAFEDPSWRDISGTERGDYLFKFSRLIDEHKETLATIETWDNGQSQTFTSHVLDKRQLISHRQAIPSLTR